MDTDKIKVFGSRIKVESVAKVAELEVAEKEKMAEKVRRTIYNICLLGLLKNIVFYIRKYQNVALK